MELTWKLPVRKLKPVSPHILTPLPIVKEHRNPVRLTLIALTEIARKIGETNLQRDREWIKELVLVLPKSPPLAPPVDGRSLFVRPKVRTLEETTLNECVARQPSVPL